MRFLLSVLVVASLNGLFGCSEFVKSNEQVSSTIDVVGDPADDVPDSQSQADILGSILPPTDEMMTETNSLTADSKQTNEDSKAANKSSIGDRRPLKTAERDTATSK